MSRSQRIHGDGFFSNVRTKLRNAAESVRFAIKGARDNVPPDSRRVLEAVGSLPILSLTVYREPIKSAIHKVLNALSFGQVDRVKARLGYDSLFHLYLVARVGSHTIRLEKNHVISIKQVSSAPTQGTDFRAAPLPNDRALTLDILMTNGANHAAANARMFYQYDAIRANCQMFLLDLLGGSGIHADDAFIRQKAEELVPGYLHGAARAVTDTASRADVIWQGRGLAAPKVRMRRFPKANFTPAQARAWLSKRGFRRVAPVQSTATQYCSRVTKS